MTNDPGTPGNANWEINIASAQTVTHGMASYQLPQIDLNFGLGERVQLTYEVPYIVQTTNGQHSRSGWSNGLPGIKWRFFDQGEDGWQLATFPQLETRGSAAAERSGIASAGPRFLLPIEVTKKVGLIDVDFEAGYYFPKNGVSERILGVVAGASLTNRCDIGVELYNDHAVGAPMNETTLDLGGRFKLTPGLVALVMAGRGIGATNNGQPEFIGYIGVQMLLKTSL